MLLGYQALMLNLFYVAEIYFVILGVLTFHNLSLAIHESSTFDLCN
jgi:hypothetical protein